MPFLAAVLAVSCGDGGTGVDEDGVGTVEVAPPSATIQPGGTVKLEAVVLDRQGDPVTNPPVSWSSSPPGIVTVSDDGLVTGVEPGATTVTATVDGVQDQASISVTAPDELEVVTQALPDATVGDAYAGTLQADGGIPPYAWSRVAGELPQGISLAADGSLSGVAQEAGEYTFTARVVSGDDQVAEVELTLVVLEVLTILTEVLPDAEVAVPYMAQLQAAGGRPPRTWTHIDGELPEGLALSDDGTVSGTPTRVGTFSFSVRVLSEDGQVAEAGVEITVGGDPLPPVITTDALPDGTVGEPYSVALDATGGSGELFWSLAAGSLPPGLELVDVGTILGVPTEPDTSTFTVRVSGDLDSDTRELTIRIEADTTLKVATSALPPGRVGVPYEETIRATGGEPPYTWSLVSGFVPSGLRLQSDGVVSGVPTQPAEATFTVRVTDSEGRVATSGLELTIESFQDSSPEGYDLTVLAVAGIAPAIRAHVNSAVSRWERVVVGDLEDLVIPMDAFAPTSCGGFGSDLNGLEVEDIAILVNVAPIDGPGRVLGRAGPCGIRDDGLPFAGILTLDSDDLEPLVGTQTLTDLVFHEIGHVVGIGTLWNEFDLLVGEGGADPRYVGASGVAQYAAIGGQAADIPVANTGGGGTRDSHWREDTFGAEIMTGYAEPVGVAMPLSVMTIGSLEDFGYEVDLDEADAYLLPGGASPEPAPAVASPGRDIAIRGPLVVVSHDGSIRLIGGG